MKKTIQLPAGEYIKAGDLITVKDGKYYKMDPIEIYTVEKNHDTIYAVILVVVIIGFIAGEIILHYVSK